MEGIRYPCRKPTIRVKARNIGEVYREVLVDQPD